MYRRSTASSFVLSMLLVLAAPLVASDGVIEVNQAKAIAGGVSAGDSPGFPVTIDTPGSYILTGALSVTDANTNVISIESNDVTIDLNGFVVRGPNTCTFSTLPEQISCSVTGTGNGIWADPLTENVAITNGIVIGAPTDGIRCSDCRLQGITIQESGRDGFSAVRAIIVGCSAKLNFTTGISAQGGVVRDSSAWRNGSRGFDLWSGTIASGIRSENNVGDGIRLATDAMVSSCTSEFNGHSAGGGGVGIRATSSGSQVRDCTIADNSGVGIDGSGWVVAYGGNSITGNNGSIINPQVSAGLVETGVNLCGTNTTCP